MAELRFLSASLIKNGFAKSKTVFYEINIYLELSLLRHRRFGNALAH